MVNQSGLKSQFNAYDQQKCFIAYTHKAPWSEDILAACNEVLPRFGLEAWYADDQFEPGRSLKDKVVEMIANARYGIFDLSAMYDNERKEWVLPRNVLIELGIAIALNRPVLLLRTAENRVRGCPLPTCLTGIDDILEFSGETTLRRALEECIPQWLNVSPEQMWWTRACLFGNRVCEYREIHPRMERWQQEGLHCHIADGPDADRVDFRCLVEDEIGRYNDLTFDYLDACKPTHPYHFVQCAHCQAVRSSQFAIYRITPQTDAETYIAIGMSIALETQFGYEIPKIFFTADVRDVPSLLSGYEVLEAVNTKGRRQRLRKALPVVVQRVEECVWKPCVLPFESHILLGSRAVYDTRLLSEGQISSEVQQSENTSMESNATRSDVPSLDVENDDNPIKTVHDYSTGTGSSEHIPNNLAALRTRHHLSQSQLAESVRVTASTLGRWERGEALPRQYNLKALCKALQCSEEDLCFSKGQISNEVSHSQNPSSLEVGYDDNTVEIGQNYDPGSLEHIPNNLAALRTKRGLSQSQLAESVGVTTLTLGRWERGEALPRQYNLKALCKALQCSEEDLGFSKGLVSQDKAPSSAASFIQRRGRAGRENDEISDTVTGLQLEPSTRRVWIDGSPLPKMLSERQSKLLRFLAERAGEVCLREETSLAVFGERYIQHRDEARLDALIERTRLHIGDDQRHPRFIETVRGVGHRLKGYFGERS